MPAALTGVHTAPHDAWPGLHTCVQLCLHFEVLHSYAGTTRKVARQSEAAHSHAQQAVSQGTNKYAHCQAQQAALTAHPHLHPHLLLYTVTKLAVAGCLPQCINSLQVCCWNGRHLCRAKTHTSMHQSAHSASLCHAFTNSRQSTT